MRTLFLLGVVFTLSFMLSFCKSETNLIEQMMHESGKFSHVLQNPETYRPQIIYTQIERDRNNNPRFKSHAFRVDKNEYFYPASTVKLPMALMALEKINELNIPGLTKHSLMQIEHAYTTEDWMPEDNLHQESLLTIDGCIREIFLVSDNDAYNYLYEFLGQAEANKRLHIKGYYDVRLTHRLSIPLTIEENKRTSAVRFYTEDSLVFEQPSAYNTSDIRSETDVYVGNAHLSNGVLVNEPMEFTYKNAISLESLHNILLAVIFPESISQTKRFNLRDDDYQYLYEYMSKYPQESDMPYYGSKYEDGYCKFLMFGGTTGHIDPNIRIYNKIGEAYGFLIDMAYIVDFERKIEFILGAVIYVNENQILNDGLYEYTSVGYPFLRDLGQLFYDYELTRPRKYAPELSRYQWKK